MTETSLFTRILFWLASIFKQKERLYKRRCMAMFDWCFDFFYGVFQPFSGKFGG